MRRIIRWGLVFITLVIAINIVVLASPSQQETSPQTLFQATLRDIRADMEVLADRAFPGATRPDGWQGNLDFTTDDMLADLFVDNELLADVIFEGERPGNWIGVSSSVADIIARNIRHDLEASADAWLGIDIRPDEWVGGPALFRCDQTLMNTAYVLDIEFGIRPVTPETVFNYCGSVSTELADELIPAAIGNQQVDDVPGLLLAVRGDLERLVDEVLGVDVRPPGWVDNTDVEDPAFIADLNSDLELLADIILDNRRPDSWLDLSAGTDLSSLRNARFNLELLTDRALGVGTRPNGWQGESQLFRCEPDVQNLVSLAQVVYDFTLPDTTVSGPAYCVLLRRVVNGAIENPPPPEVLADLEAEEAANLLSAESRNAFAYLDPAALQYMGVLPWGTEFRAWYRNFGGSTMMFVSGEGFAIFIDRRFTTMTEEVFRTLPTLDGVDPLTFCDALWCNGPAPTPTPTGSGPILEIINSGTEPAQSLAVVTPDADTEGKRLVTWNYIRVEYQQFREDVGTALVTLEICTEPNQLVCEPVISVFNTLTQAGVTPSGSLGGLNVYELPFGYSTNFVIEGETLFSNDVWLNDPTLSTGGDQ
ncbi:MAG: hypothetical protein AAFR81_19135 [Chloroflexota bacterium]